MTEVEIYGGGHFTRLNNQLVCLWGAPSPVYKGVEDREGRPLYGAPKGTPTPTGSRIPPLGARPIRLAGPLLHSFIDGGGGTP